MVAAETMAAVDRVHGRELERLARRRQRLQGRDGDVDTDGLALGYVPGKTITTGLAKGAELQGAPAGLGGLGKIESVAASATAEGRRRHASTSPLKSPDSPSDRGVQPDARRDVPGEAAGLRHRAHVDKRCARCSTRCRRASRTSSSSAPRCEQALGLTLEGDVLAALQGRARLGVYGEASGTIPVTVDAVLTVDDEAKATHLMERLGALAAAWRQRLDREGAGRRRAGDGAGALRRRSTRSSGSYDGKLVISTSKAGIEQLHGSSDQLADDSAYTDAKLAAAGVPDKVDGPASYADLQTAVPLRPSASAAPGRRRGRRRT